MSEFFLATGLIFVAELGDKSQLVALWFATRYRWWTVLAGVTAATLLLTLASVVGGRVLDNLIPEDVLVVVVGLSFLGFAWWSLQGEELSEDDLQPRTSSLGAFGVVFVAFFLSELGDKTQLATAALAGRESSFVGVWLGATLGMVLSSALAIGLGMVAGKRLPARVIKRMAAGLFVVFGLVTIGSVFV